MTMREIVKKLEAQGHSVNYYVRKDGGILIKRIDGEVFTHGASGNIKARQLLGVELSQARARQLTFAKRQRKSSLAEDIETEFQRVKKIWKKAFPSKKGKAPSAGYFGRRRIKYAVEHYGKEEALRRIKEAERYASGLAYAKNIQILAQYIRSAGEQYQSAELVKLSQDLIENAYTIKEEWIAPAYDELYKLNAGIPPKEIARNTRAILRL